MCCEDTGSDGDFWGVGYLKDTGGDGDFRVVGCVARILEVMVTLAVLDM